MSMCLTALFPFFFCVCSVASKPKVACKYSCHLIEIESTAVLWLLKCNGVEVRVKQEKV